MQITGAYRRASWLHSLDSRALIRELQYQQIQNKLPNVELHSVPHHELLDLLYILIGT